MLHHNILHKILYMDYYRYYGCALEAKCISLAVSSGHRSNTKNATTFQVSLNYCMLSPETIRPNFERRQNGNWISVLYMVQFFSISQTPSNKKEKLCWRVIGSEYHNLFTWQWKGLTGITVLIWMVVIYFTYIKWINIRHQRRLSAAGIVTHGKYAIW